MADETAAFDPRGILAALDRSYVSYVLIGGLARVLRGADEITAGVDICPSLRPDNLERLDGALTELEARRRDRRTLRLDQDSVGGDPVIALRTANGELKIVPEPAGTRGGWDDLRRGATREHIGEGLRPYIASVPDLARMAAALGRQQDLARLPELRRIMEVEVRLQRTLGLER